MSTFAGDSIKAARILREKCGYELRPRIRKQEYAGTRKRKAPRYLPLVYLPGRKCKLCGNPIRPWNATGICNTNTFCQTTSRRIKMYVRRGGRPITPWWFYPGAIDAPRGETK